MDRQHTSLHSIYCRGVLTVVCCGVKVSYSPFGLFLSYKILKYNMIKQYLPLYDVVWEQWKIHILHPHKAITHPFKKADHATEYWFNEYLFIIIYAIAFNLPLRPVTAFVSDVIEAVYCAIAKISPYSAHGDGTMIYFYWLIHIG